MALRLASYNVHRAIGRDRRCEPQRILDVIREIDPDVVALQVFALDRLWTHPGSILRELKAHNSALASAASDHLPLVATLDL